MMMGGKTFVGNPPLLLLLVRASQTLCILLLFHFIYTNFFLCKDASCTLLYSHSDSAAPGHEGGGGSRPSTFNDTKAISESNSGIGEEAAAAAGTIQELQGMRNLSNMMSTDPTHVPAQVGGSQLHLHPITSLLTKLVNGESQTKHLETSGIACDYKYFYPVFCVINNMVSVEYSGRGLHLVRIQSQTQLNSTAMSPSESQQVSPYAWHQAGQGSLKSITPVKIIHTNAAADCEYNHHQVPAVIFSAGGFIGNLFHEFDEIIIPLFLTTRLFQSGVQFIITDYNPYFVNKYSSILSGLSRFPIINAVENSSSVNACFPGAIVGLKFHSSLAINSTDAPLGYSMLAFKEFLRETYKLKVRNVAEMMNKKPILILISREKTRKFVNEGEMVKMVEALGFQVMVARTKEMSNLEAFSKIVGSCSVLVGAHGAGLTNQIFLPVGALLVQVVPLGLQWPSSACFGDPAQGMGVKYLEYMIEPEESTLFDVYGPDHPVITDPASMFAKGYQVGRAVYLESQNIRVNITRFKETLGGAIPLLIVDDRPTLPKNDLH